MARVLSTKCPSELNEPMSENCVYPTVARASIWLMNGTTPISQVPIGGNPGANWHIHAAS
jgi:hypothetical protein